MDRLVIDEKIRVRLSDSVETALKWGEGRLLLLQQPPDAALSDPWAESLHSNRNYSPATGLSFETPTPKHFSFNSPAGACPVCHGLGQKMVFDERLIVPDPDKSLEKGAVLPWRRGGKRMMVYYKSLLRGMAEHFGQSLETPWKDLPEDFKQKLLRGTGEENVEFTFWRAGSASKVQRPFEGVIPNLRTALRRERKRIHPQPAQGLYEPAAVRRLRRTPPQARNPGRPPRRSAPSANVAGHRIPNPSQIRARSFPAFPSWTFAPCPSRARTISSPLCN